jgi:hypothetical protein
VTADELLEKMTASDEAKVTAVVLEVRLMNRRTRIHDEAGSELTEMLTALKEVELT